jgi:hypothetical protein
VYNSRFAKVRSKIGWVRLFLSKIPNSAGHVNSGDRGNFVAVRPSHNVEYLIIYSMKTTIDDHEEQAPGELPDSEAVSNTGSLRGSKTGSH